MKWGRNITFGMLVVSVVFSTMILGRNLWVQEKEQMKFERLRQKVVEERDEFQMQYMEAAPKVLKESVNDKRTVLPEYQELAKENSDFLGWISIEGTHIDYPVMQTLGDTEYYLHRNFEKDDSYAGVPFVGSGDMKKEGDIFLYGHNMRNGTMFADLLNYQNQDHYEAHPLVQLDTLWEHRTYEIFTVLYAQEDDWVGGSDALFHVTDGKNLSEQRAYFLKLKQYGIYETGIIPDGSTSLLYLVTCCYQTNGGRLKN